MVMEDSLNAASRDGHLRLHEMVMEDSLNAEGCFTHETDTHEGLDMRRLVLKPFKKHNRHLLVCDLMCRHSADAACCDLPHRSCASDPA